MSINNKELKVPRVAVGVLIENDKGEIFLAKSETNWHGLWIVPGGHLEYGETLEDCVQREVMEEIGVRITNIKLIQVQELLPKNKSEYHRKERHLVFINFSAQLLDHDPSIVLEERELQEYQFIKPQEALAQDDIARNAINLNNKEGFLRLNSSTRRLIEEFLEQRGAIR